MRAPFLAVLRGSILIAGVIVWFGAACTQQNAKAPKRDLVDCYAHALEPVAGEVFDTAELAKDLVAGKADLGAVLHNLQADEASVASTLKAVRACLAPPTAPVIGGTAS